ncbi:acyltransferase [Galactobacter sp.]|uniref:acyltransferase n=1 Tax=Galactobacter sp. TaxID=2676125 RepID=UPI0025B9AFDB|nr:acyltransferase [Galactobacter sp.]
MIILTKVSPYNDELGNVVDCSDEYSKNVKIVFRGKNNRLVIEKGARIDSVSVAFDCDNGVCKIGAKDFGPGVKLKIRVGQDSSVILGDNVSTTGQCLMTAAEGSKVVVGSDVMIASGNYLRADDGHPIFDVSSGRRMNPSADIIIGDHVWLATKAVVLGGAVINEGSVVGFGSIVTSRIPNNCIAVGSPAKVVRKNIAWERPNLTKSKPYYKTDASTVKKSKFWNLTDDGSSSSESTAKSNSGAKSSARPVIVRHSPLRKRAGRLVRAIQRRIPKGK